jgi:VCBS repeat protein/FG-GAP repeat protein
VQAVGVGTTGTAGVPRIQVEGTPAVGSALSIRVVNGPPNGVGRLLFSTQEGERYLPHYLAFLYAGSPRHVRTVHLDEHGTSEVLYEFPEILASSCGVSFVCQAVLSDDEAWNGKSFSRGIRIQFGEIEDKPGSELYAGENLGLSTGFEPWHSAVGDLDLDGLPDLVVAASRADDVFIHMGSEGGLLESGGFEVGHWYEVGDFPAFVLIEDLNCDGIPDIVAANAGSDDLSVLLGVGGGEFQEETRVEFQADSPQWLLAEDLNADCFPDLICTNWHSGTISILIGDGDGTFTEQGTTTVGNGPKSAVTGDFDQDGRLDLAVANEVSDSIFVMRGQVDGSFLTTHVYHVGDAALALDAADFNCDGDLDLVVLHENSDTGSLLLGDEAALFQPPLVFETGGPQPRSLAVADFDLDGWLDLAIANNLLNDVTLLLGSGDGLFGAAIPFFVGLGPTSVCAADLDLDGTPDLVVTTQDDDSCRVLLNQLYD